MSRLPTSADIARRSHRLSVGTPETCLVPGCHRPTQRSAAQGLSELYCKVHIEFHRRHGSYWRRSYLAWELAPYRTAARRWLREHRQKSLVAAVVGALDQMLDSAGRSESAYDLRGMPPAEKARIALARVRQVGATGVRLLEIALAVSAKVNDAGPYDPEFRDVQIAKVVHRLASGTHRSTSGFPMRSKYAPSAGRILRILGHRIWDIAAIAADDAARQEVISIARRHVAPAQQRAAKRKAAMKTVAHEIERARRAGMGPQRLALYRRQLNRQLGVK